jgi:hypothetical protein
MDQQNLSSNSTETTKAPKPTHLGVTIVTGDRVVYDGLADRVVAPAVSGQISILLRHAPLLATLEPGELMVRLDDHTESMAVGGGFIEVRRPGDGAGPLLWSAPMSLTGRAEPRASVRRR